MNPITMSTRHQRENITYQFLNTGFKKTLDLKSLRYIIFLKGFYDFFATKNLTSHWLKCDDGKHQSFWTAPPDKSNKWLLSNFADGCWRCVCTLLFCFLILLNFFFIFVGARRAGQGAEAGAVGAARRRPHAEAARRRDLRRDRETLHESEGLRESGQILQRGSCVLWDGSQGQRGRGKKPSCVLTAAGLCKRWQPPESAGWRAAGGGGVLGVNMSLS